MNILLACPRILFRCLLVEPLPALAGRAVAIDGGCKVLKRILSCTLMVAFGLFAPLWASPVSAGSADSLNLLADPRYWEAVTPEQARALIAGRSLAGMRSEKKYAGDKDALTPLMAAAWRTPYPEIIDLLVKAGGEVDATTGKSVSYSVPGTPNPGLHAHTESIVTA
ncbi:MAG: hypothetical protein LBD67_01515, partial [Candidatus Accumulibacter sp.]|nr:hypothetical protein [Accumulibacter sp.]